MDAFILFNYIIGILLIVGCYSIPVFIIIYIYELNLPSCDCKTNKYLNRFIQYWTLFITLYFIIHTILVSIKKELNKLVIFNKYIVFVLSLVSILSSILLFNLVSKIDNQNCICRDKVKKIHSFLYTFRYFILVFLALILHYILKSF
jgi:hypothetical protein